MGQLISLYAACTSWQFKKKQKAVLCQPGGSSGVKMAESGRKTGQNKELWQLKGNTLFHPEKTN